MSLIQITVHDQYVRNRAGTTKNGKSFNLNIQENITAQIGLETRVFPITLEQGQAPYQPGKYTLDPVAILKMGDYGLEVDRYKKIELKPVQSNAVPRAA